MDNKKNKTLAIVLGIFALVIVTTAASFAFFTYSRTGNTTSTIISGDIEFSFIEGTSATLANAFPVSDSIGAVDTTGEYSFDVKLASSSNSNKMNYNVLLVDNNDEADTDYFNNEQIKFAIVKNNTYVANTSSTSGVKLSDIDGFDELSNQGEGIVLQDQEITAGTTDNYKLRIWISDDVNYSNTIGGQDNQESTGKHNSYKYSLKVKVTSGIAQNEDYLTGVIKNLKVNKLTMTAELINVQDFSEYAVTISENSPSEYSNEWIDLSTTAQNNVIRTSSSKTRTIKYMVKKNGTYYLHIKYKNGDVVTQSFVANSVGENAVQKIVNLASTNTNELRIDEHEATGQQDFVATEYRYWGATPNNYVWFNDELWRIIGAMDVDDGTGKVEKRLKIMRNDYLHRWYAWYSSEWAVNGGYGINEWSQSHLMQLLNTGAYYNRTTGTCYDGPNNSTFNCDFSDNSNTPGLTDESKEMIGNAKWYLSGLNDLNVTADELYISNRSLEVGRICTTGDYCDSLPRTLNWTGKIGLIYSSDYAYSTDYKKCSNIMMAKYGDSCSNDSWIYNKGINDWTINGYHYREGSFAVTVIDSQGGLYVQNASAQYITPRPAVYLLENIKILDGDGTIDMPYILSK